MQTHAHLARADEVGAEAVFLLVVEEDRPVRAVPHVASVGPPGRVGGWLIRVVLFPSRAPLAFPSSSPSPSSSSCPLLHP